MATRHVHSVTVYPSRITNQYIECTDGTELCFLFLPQSDSVNKCVRSAWLDIVSPHSSFFLSFALLSATGLYLFGVGWGRFQLCACALNTVCKCLQACLHCPGSWDGEEGIIDACVPKALFVD
jgi:hypothetical protein